MTNWVICRQNICPGVSHPPPLHCRNGPDCNDVNDYITESLNFLVYFNQSWFFNRIILIWISIKHWFDNLNTGFFLLLAVLIYIPFSMKGIVKALQLFQQQLIDHKVSIFVRRGGPNYQEGLRIMRELGKSVLF